MRLASLRHFSFPRAWPTSVECKCRRKCSVLLLNTYVKTIGRHTHSKNVPSPWPEVRSTSFPSAVSAGRALGDQPSGI